MSLSFNNYNKRINNYNKRNVIKQKRLEAASERHIYKIGTNGSEGSEQSSPEFYKSNLPIHRMEHLHLREEL